MTALSTHLMSMSGLGLADDKTDSQDASTTALDEHPGKHESSRPPTSSSRTSDWRVAAARRQDRRRTWPLKVDRLCCRSWLSPTSASTLPNHCSRGGPPASGRMPGAGASTGRKRPDFAMSAMRPMVLREAVLPPACSQSCVRFFKGIIELEVLGRRPAGRAWRDGWP